MRMVPVGVSISTYDSLIVRALICDSWVRAKMLVLLAQVPLKGDVSLRQVPVPNPIRAPTVRDGCYTQRFEQATRPWALRVASLIVARTIRQDKQRSSAAHRATGSATKIQKWVQIRTETTLLRPTAGADSKETA